MTKETSEKILDSQFKEIYYELMLTDQTGSNYIKAIQLTHDINTILRKSRTSDRKNKEYLDLAIVNEIYSDVVKEVMGIDCVTPNDCDTIVILSASVARELIKNGFVLKDIKPNKNDRKKTVFVFQKTDSLLLHIKSKDYFKNDDEHSLEC